MYMYKAGEGWVVRTVWAGNCIITIWGVVWFINHHSLLIFNIRYGHLPLVKYLVEDLKCSTISLAGALRETPLHTACR